MTMQVFCHNGSCRYANQLSKQECHDCDILDQVEFDVRKIEFNGDFSF